MPSNNITIAQKDILFDMEMLSYGFSEVSGGPEARRADRLALDKANDSQKKTMEHLVEKRLGEVCQLMEKFVSSYSLSSNNYTISLTNMDEAHSNIDTLLKDLIAEYIVNGSLADYYTHMGAGVNTETLNARCNAALARIRELIYYRTMPTIS